MTTKSPALRVGISMPMLNQPIDRFAELARLADEAEFDSVWSYEFYRNPFIAQGLTAGVTNTIDLYTGIATACSRTPFEMANAAADVDEVSGGRMVVGLSPGAASFSDALNGTEMNRPVARMREYITVMRAVWDYFRTGEPTPYAGEFYNFTPPPFNPYGSRPLARPRIPIHVGALRPAMMRMGGEIADGVVGFLMSPSYLEERLRPHVAEGWLRAYVCVVRADTLLPPNPRSAFGDPAQAVAAHGT
jgi:alkanesulfonate monooxygenase SsuD/methylene tetrahydromethanopterin reductase-like flavin-dependent oxidoreductase (luciferase family)